MLSPTIEREFERTDRELNFFIKSAQVKQAVQDDDPDLGERLLAKSLALGVRSRGLTPTQTAQMEKLRERVRRPSGTELLKAIPDAVRTNELSPIEANRVRDIIGNGLFHLWEAYEEAHQFD